MLARLTKHAFVRNAISLYGIQVAGYVLPLITFPYVAGILGKEKFGLITWSQAFIAYFQTVTEYGFNFSVVRDISIHRDDPAKLNSIYSAATAARFLLMLLSLAVMSIIVFSVPKFRAEWALMYIGFLAVIGLAAFPQWLFQGMERMGYITVREIGARLLGLMVVFILVRRREDYLWAAAIMSGSTAIAGIIGLLYVPKLTGVRFTSVSWEEIWRVLVEGWHIFLSTASINLYTRSNLFILGFVGTEAEVGIYAFASRWVETAKALVFPMSNSIYPHVIRLAADSRTEAVTFIRKSIPRVFAPFLLLSVGIWVVMPVGIHAYFGSQYNESIPLLRIMAPTPVITALGTCFATFFMMGFGYKRQWGNMIIATTAVNFVILIPLLLSIRPHYAVAITSVAVEAFVMVVSYWFWRRHYGDRRNRIGQQIAPEAA